MADELIGQKLGQYEIRMLLGRGGMSSVYLAYQPSMDRTVAIKILPREFLHDTTFLTRFQQEARVIARLEHLHILPVYDVGEDQGIPYIVSRYLPGGTLADLINHGIPDLQRTVRLIGQVADALDYAHERGIIHRDLKPSNVLLDSTGNAYLSDFGIARMAQQQAGLTGSRIVGTPPYVAPEMVRKNQQVTHSADIYALGIITYEMLTGMPPYVDEDPMKVLMAHVLEPVPNARSVDPNIGQAVNSVLMRCLAKRPEDRYRTAGAFARALQEATELESETIPAPAEGPPPGWETIPAPARRAEPALPAPPAPAPPVERHAPQPAPRLKAPNRERRIGCWLPAVVLLLMGLGVALTTFALTGGDLTSLLAQGDGAPPPGGGLPATSPPGDNPGETPQPGAGDSPLPAPAGGGRLVFASSRDGDYEIYLIDLDGTGLRQLTDNNVGDFDADWSPDGTQIVFASYADGDAGDNDPEIKVMNSDGSEVRQLTQNAAKDADPAWSPDGIWIAFASDRDGDFDLYLMRPDGSDVRQLTFNDRDDLSPAWSPDSRLLAYYAQSDNNEAASELYVLDVFGDAPPRRLTDNVWFDKWPSWSPDGTQIVFTSGQGLENGRRAVFVYSMLTGEVTRLTEGAFADDDPVWSPDGGAIAFDSNRDGDSFFDLYVYDIASGETRQLTFELANDVAPAWQPQP
ncbi:MAG: hypothetical protein Kow00124_14350 [Anaerolineae bacterium]